MFANSLASVAIDAPADQHVRTDWTREEIANLFDLPFTELVFRAALPGKSAPI